MPKFPTITKVQKRSGEIVEFDREKIRNAVFKALTVTGQGDGKESKKVSERVVAIMERRFNKDEVPTVEQIQDIVEEILILEGLVDTAKAYILYREQRRRIREAGKVVDESTERVDKYLKELDWQVYENANMTFSLQGLNQYAISNISKKYWLNKIYPEKIREAAVGEDFHLHDLDSISTYCCGWDLYDILKRGFGGVPGKIESRPPKHFQTALGQLVNFFYTVQGESAGAQAVSNLDTLLAPYIRYDGLSYPQVKQAMQEFLYNCMIPTRVGFQTPFLNVSLDIKPPSYLADQPVIIGGKLQEDTYGEFQDEMNMFIRAFYEGLMEGDAKGRPFSVDSDSLCPIKNSEKIKLVKIGEYIDNLMRKSKPMYVRENNCQVLDVKDLNIKSLGLKDGKISWQKVNFLVRHPLDSLLKIESQGGFSVKVTPSHSVLILRDGEIKNFEAGSLKLGDHLIMPKTFPRGGNKVLKISLAEEFLKRKKGKGIYIRTCLANARQNLKCLPSASYCLRNVLKNNKAYKERKTRPCNSSSYRALVFPLLNIKEKLDELDLSRSELSLSGSAFKIANYLPVTEDLMEFLGWYCAEGSAEKNKKYGGVSLGFDLKKEKRQAQRIAKLAKKIFGTPSKIREIKNRNLIEVRIHSKLVRRIITEIFRIKKGKERKVPQIIFELSPRMKKIFLQSYFQGDAWITKDIIATSISRELIYGVSTLLKQLNVFHTLEEYTWKGRKRWRVSIWQNQKLEAKDSHSISKIPIKESGLEGIIEEVLKKEHYFYDSLGRKYKNSKNRIFQKFGVSRQSSASPEKAEKIIKYAKKLKIKIPPVFEEIRELSFLKVKKIKQVSSSNGMVYDFSTESENFVADQILVHNTFPIPTVSITKDFDWDNPALESMWEATAKYGVNYFSNFVNSDMNPEDARSMCCRLRLNNKELIMRGGGLFGSNPLTGSVGVVTINLPRIGYLSKTQKEFFQRLKNLMILAKESLEIKRKTLDDFIEKGLYPYSRHYLAAVKKMRGSYFGNHFSTIGLMGMNEALQNFLGEDMTTTKGRKFALEVMGFMRDELVDFQKETGNLYNLEATPAEGTSYRQAKIDKEKYPDIITAGTNEEPYYTNSSQLPVGYTDDLFEALKLQDEIQCEYTGGCIERGNRVLTDKGLIPIESIVKDFKKLRPIRALSYNSEKRRSEWDKIVKAVEIDVKKEDKIRIKGERGLNIVTSDWHPFFVLERFRPNPACPICKEKVKNINAFATHIRFNPECREKYKNFPKYKVVEKRADELKEGDYILQNEDNVYPKKETGLSGDLMWLVGFFIGDGHISKFIDNRGGNSLTKYKVRFHSENKEALEKARRIISKHFGAVCKVIKNDTRSEPLRELGVSKRDVWEFFLNYGFKADKKVYNIFIPGKVKEELSKDNVYSLLSGLIDSDGHIDKKQGDLEYYTVSSRLADDVLEMCSLAGIMVSKTKKKVRRKNEVDIYRLRVPCYQLKKIKDRLEVTGSYSKIKKEISSRRKRHLPVVRVKEVSKAKVKDDYFYDLMTEKNHNYAAGGDTLVFIHNTVLHGFLGEKINDPSMAKALVKKIAENFHLPYFTLTPTFSICPVHGYLSGEHFHCPKCTIKQPCEVYSRVVGYIRPVSQWNYGKRKEFEERKEFKTEQSPGEKKGSKGQKTLT